MKKYIGVAVLAFLLIALIGTANATPIAGSSNEIVNGDFETGVFSPWVAGSGMVIATDGPGHALAAVCKAPNSDTDKLRQIVDETLNPLWNGNFHAKLIDLQADIRVSWTPGDAGHPTSDIKFRLDWWNESHNGDTLAQLPVTPDGVTNYVTFTFTSADGNGIWKTVNPFDQIYLHNEAGERIQPRWVSVEVLIDQTPGEEVWVDNVILTSKCVGNEIPEPMTIVLGCMGLGSIAGLRRLRRK